MADRSTLHQRMDALERKLGRGATFDRSTRDDIAAGIVPSWVFLAVKLCKGADAEQAAELAGSLRALHRRVADRIAINGTGGSKS